jgi:hypothetical protein
MWAAIGSSDINEVSLNSGMSCVSALGLVLFINWRLPQSKLEKSRGIQKKPLMAQIKVQYLKEQKLLNLGTKSQRL